MNPYAKYLGNRDPVETIAETSATLQELMSALGPEGAKRALAPGKWSAREILCHLADTELVFAVRLRQTLAEPHHVIQPFDQDRWAATYAPFDAQAALVVFTAVRNWNLKLIETAPEGAFSKPVMHPERGEMTFRTIVETMAGHDLNHLGQIETIAGKTD
jgi:DinB superfamily